MRSFPVNQIISHVNSSATKFKVSVQIIHQFFSFSSTNFNLHRLDLFLILDQMPNIIIIFSLEGNPSGLIFILCFVYDFQLRSFLCSISYYCIQFNSSLSSSLFFQIDLYINCSRHFMLYFSQLYFEAILTIPQSHLTLIYILEHENLQTIQMVLSMGTHHFYISHLTIQLIEMRGYLFAQLIFFISKQGIVSLIFYLRTLNKMYGHIYVIEWAVTSIFSTLYNSDALSGHWTRTKTSYSLAHLDCLNSFVWPSI